MDNKQYFNIKTTPINKYLQGFEIEVDLAEEVLKDSRIYDSNLLKNEQLTCYSLKSLWGIPKQIQKAITNLTKYNTNQDPN